MSGFPLEILDAKSLKSIIVLEGITGDETVLAIKKRVAQKSKQYYMLLFNAILQSCVSLLNGKLCEQMLKERESRTIRRSPN